jgi:hypothetical protein
MTVSNSKRDHRASIRIRTWLPIALFVAITIVWLWTVWAPAPLIIDTSDGGNVASIAAGWLNRARFASDLVLSSSAASRFYMALSIPVTMLLTSLTHDIGQAYVMLIVPILLFQLVGFYKLGLLLFEDRRWSFLLALLSVPPVYVFGGEIWGLLGMPLTRAFYGAAVPYLLIILVRWRGTLSDTLWLMAGCGGALYLHPVSAPSIALAIWLALLAAKPGELSWRRHFGHLILGGLLFVAICMPFAIIFEMGFPSATHVKADDAAGVAANLLAQLAGPQYYDVRVATQQIIDGGGVGAPWGWVWSVWFAGLAGLVCVPLLWREKRGSAVRLRNFCVGVVIASFGLCLIDQTVAHLLGRRPVQIDLARNIRFLVPCLLIFGVWLMSALSRLDRSGKMIAPLLLVLGVACTFGWWKRFPTPLSVAENTLLHGNILAPATLSTNSVIVSRIAQLPAGSRILPLGSADMLNVIELVGLALRYAAFQPVAYLQKDVNLLAYSGSDRVGTWLDSTDDLARLDALNGPDATQALLAFCRARQVDYVLLYTNGLPPGRAEALSATGSTLATEGPWQLVHVSARP